MPPQTPKNSGKFLFYIIEAIAFLTVIILAIVLTFMHKTTPKLRLQSITIHTLTLNHTSSPSFTITFDAQLTLKNSNFGQFRFPDGKIAIIHGDNVVGNGVIPGGRAKARSTEKMNVKVVAEARNIDGDLGGELSSGKIRLWSNATVKGTIRVIMRKATANMNCTMDVDTKAAAVQNLKCI